jgi:hypothetical protein
MIGDYEPSTFLMEVFNPNPVALYILMNEQIVHLLAPKEKILIPMIPGWRARTDGHISKVLIVPWDDCGMDEESAISMDIGLKDKDITSPFTKWASYPED